MSKKLLSLVLLPVLTLLLMCSNRNCMDTHATNDFHSLNPLIEVGSKIYVQHDENNYNVYELKKSGTGTTTIYEVIIPEFTANKVWTIHGVYMDNIVKNDKGNLVAHGATAPDKYIPVHAGEEYFLRTYGVGGVKVSDTEFYYYAPVLFLDDNDNVIADALTNTFSKSKAGVFVTVPEGATRMHLTMYGNQSFTIQKVLHVTDAEFDSLVMDQTALVNSIDQAYENYQKDPTLYKRLDKAYITFVNDDTRWQLDQYADLFIEKNVPLVLATIPDALIENASSQAETRLQVAKRVVDSGGEIMAHNGIPLTADGFSDYGTMYSFFVRTKQLFNFYGFDVNGIILSGGSGQVVGAKESERWASSIYSYSDLYGVEYKNKDICTDSVYFHGRGGLVNFGNDVAKIQASIDDVIAKKKWQVYYFHDSNDITLEAMSQVLDYVNSKSDAEVEVVTYKEMYERFAEKESVIKDTNYTYYVSSTGTSSTGLSAEDPMSYETAQSKTYFSGDTILFKRGDTFYGTFQPKISVTNDKATTISSYGDGELPIICGYKIADSEASWQYHSEGIYKVPLKDNNYFSGLTSIDDNSCNIGFLEDENGVKYYNKKESLSLSDEYDFYCDGNYIYMKCNENPYNKLGTLKMATKTNLLMLSSNMKVENLHLCGTGAHGMVGCNADTDNVVISGNVIEDIGGSYLKNTIRYGNGIEFYGTNASNIVVENNIIRNVYDVGFTIQGTAGSGENIVVKNNVFVNNSQDSEIWESGNATGVKGYEFADNISINQGRGWGYEARPDKYVAAHILFWQYLIEDTDIYFHNNLVYNPRRLYFIEQSNGTNIYFKEKDYIRSDYNTYFLTEETKLFRDSYSIADKDEFISEYKKDANSVFILIEADEELLKTAATSNEINTINHFFKPEGDASLAERLNGKVIYTAEDIEEATKHKHTISDWTVSKEPTASEDGLKEKTCTLCGEVLESELLPKYTVSFHVSGTIPLQLKDSTTAVKVNLMEGDKVASYESSDKKVVTVNSKGKITAKKLGTASITVTTKKGATASIKVKVQKGAVKTKKITVDKKKLSLQPGKGYALQITKTPVTSSDKITFATSNEEIATVNSKGEITAKKTGKATITIKCGKKKATVKVTVK